MLRPLRIAVSVVSGICCVLLVVVWVRRYWWYDTLQMPCTWPRVQCAYINSAAHRHDVIGGGRDDVDVKVFPGGLIRAGGLLSGMAQKRSWPDLIGPAS